MKNIILTGIKNKKLIINSCDSEIITNEDAIDKNVDDIDVYNATVDDSNIDNTNINDVNNDIKNIVEKNKTIRNLISKDKTISNNIQELGYKKEINLINNMYLDISNNFHNENLFIIKELNKKISGYKNQDKKSIYNEKNLITFDKLLEKLVISKLKCNYCMKNVKLFTNIRETWNNGH